MCELLRRPILVLKEVWKGVPDWLASIEYWRTKRQHWKPMRYSSHASANDGCRKCERNEALEGAGDAKHRWEHQGSPCKKDGTSTTEKALTRSRRKCMRSAAEGVGKTHRIRLLQQKCKGQTPRGHSMFTLVASRSEGLRMVWLQSE